MKRTSFAKWPCSIARTIDLIGDWWTPLVLREAFYGVTRFEEMQRSLGIGRNVLTERLQRLVAEEILERRKYQDHPERFEYKLTEKGRELFPVFAAVARWGDRWLDRGRGAPVLFRHRPCGHITQAEVVCAECRRPLELSEMESELGPGFPQRLLTHPQVRARFGTTRRETPPRPVSRRGAAARREQT